MYSENASVGIGREVRHPYYTTGAAFYYATSQVL